MRFFLFFWFVPTVRHVFIIDSRKNFFFLNILPSSDFIRELHTLHKSPPTSMNSK